MKSKLLAEGDHGRTFVVVLDPGEEAFGAIRAFATQEGIDGAQVTAIGAFSSAVVGFFEPARKEYRRIPVDQQAEVLSALGDIAAGDDGAPSLHLHVVLGLSDGSCRGGHLLEARVSPTLELIVTETPKGFRRRRREEMGVALVDV
ncbi:PPC domain-containing DNA-binding protein [Arvimicrobium flavum]|uniref:PPC domain-containing DNA-binding protein n=1 Tax=Arvimicrobium flavum TaxID=3393320 RepID=UPI00237A676B|nr:PPC domain-containing DNA-binding protein [Mesorhizobium shangrilense]